MDFIYLKKTFFLIMFLAMLGLRLTRGLFSVVASGSCSLVAVHKLLIAVASLVREHRLWVLGHQQLQPLGSRAQAQHCGAQA